MDINKNFANLKESYLFSEIARKVREFGAARPDVGIIRLGIGDVTLPLAPVVVDALQKAAAEMGEAATFRGYGEEQGYLFAREAVAGYYAQKGAAIGADEVFIGDGAKSDIGNLPDIFGVDNEVLIPDPVYPAYVDANIMAGRRLRYMDGNWENGFLPMPDGRPTDLIYLCSPNNPTGAVYSREQLGAWVDYANDCGAVILFDAAYEIFVGGEDLPTSIFQIPGADKCAIEFGTLSKTAGFTGTRFSYVVMSKNLERGGFNLHKLWMRRQSTKFNGVPYIVQRGGAAVFTDEGLAQIDKNIAYYKENASILGKTLADLGISYIGGENAPYLWLKCPNNMPSWDFFDYLLTNTGIVGTPGAGFGANGEGYFRLSAFGSRENVIRACELLRDKINISMT